MRSIILAGGLGTRLRPLTYETPKPLLPIRDRPLIEWAILNLKKHGIEDIILSIGYKAGMIKEHFKDGSQLGVRISYNIEKEPLGTGGAVADICRKHNLKEPFALLWGDNLADYDFTGMSDLYQKSNASLVMSLTQREDVEHFGVAELDGEKIMGFTEKPKREHAPSNLINAGAFIVNSEALAILPEGKSSIERDCFEKLIGKNSRVYAHKHNGYWYPTDNLEKYKKAEKEFKA